MVPASTMAARNCGSPWWRGSLKSVSPKLNVRRTAFSKLFSLLPKRALTQLLSMAQPAMKSACGSICQALPGLMPFLNCRMCPNSWAMITRLLSAC